MMGTPQGACLSTSLVCPTRSPRCSVECRHVSSKGTRRYRNDMFLTAHAWAPSTGPPPELICNSYVTGNQRHPCENVWWRTHIIVVPATIFFAVRCVSHKFRKPCVHRLPKKAVNHSPRTSSTVTLMYLRVPIEHT
ncbi:unnamed protein product [Ectocarpus sp. 12 AP-2014]